MRISYDMKVIECQYVEVELECIKVIDCYGNKFRIIPNLWVSKCASMAIASSLTCDGYYWFNSDKYHMKDGWED